MTVRARNVFEQARDMAEPLLITHLVLLETLWVLGSAYKFTRPAIPQAVDNLLALPSVFFESDDLVREFVRQGRSSNLDLADILIGLQAKEAHAISTLTFDNKATKSSLFEGIA